MSSDRHKVPRVVESGAAKRKRLKDEEDKKKQLLAKTRRMTDFVSVSGTTGRPSTSTQCTDIVVETIDTRNVDQAAQAQVKQEVMSEVTESEMGINKVKLHDNSVVVENAEMNDTTANEPAIDSTASRDVPDQVDQDDTDNLNDIGLWSGRLTRDHVDSWARKGSGDLQNCDDKLFELKSSKQQVTVTGQKRLRRCTLYNQYV